MAKLASLDRKKAVHEAAHAVVIDALGWKVTSVNIGGNAPQMTKAEWGSLPRDLEAADWSDAAQRTSLSPIVLRYVTVLVAGHLAENQQDESALKVSERLTREKLEAGAEGQADADRVAFFLKAIQQNTLDVVREAEKRAGEILQDRRLQHGTLADLLMLHKCVEGEVLVAALRRGA